MPVLMRWHTKFEARDYDGINKSNVSLWQQRSRAAHLIEARNKSTYLHLRKNNMTMQPH